MHFCSCPWTGGMVGWECSTQCRSCHESTSRVASYSPSQAGNGTSSNSSPPACSTACRSDSHLCLSFECGTSDRSPRKYGCKCLCPTSTLDGLSPCSTWPGCIVSGFSCFVFCFESWACTVRSLKTTWVFGLLLACHSLRVLRLCCFRHRLFQVMVFHRCCSWGCGGIYRSCGSWTRSSHGVGWWFPRRWETILFFFLIFHPRWRLLFRFIRTWSWSCLVLRWSCACWWGPWWRWCWWWLWVWYPNGLVSYFDRWPSQTSQGGRSKRTTFSHWSKSWAFRRWFWVMLRV